MQARRAQCIPPEGHGERQPFKFCEKSAVLAQIFTISPQLPKPSAVTGAGAVQSGQTQSARPIALADAVIRAFTGDLNVMDMTFL